MIGEDAARTTVLVGVVAAWTVRVIGTMLRGVRVTRRHRFMSWVLTTTGLLNGA